MYRYIMNEYGITVDRRHLLLLSDVMTFKGMVCIMHVHDVLQYSIRYVVFIV